MKAAKLQVRMGKKERPAGKSLESLESFGKTQFLGETEKMVRSSVNRLGNCDWRIFAFAVQHVFVSSRCTIVRHAWATCDNRHLNLSYFFILNLMVYFLFGFFQVPKPRCMLHTDMTAINEDPEFRHSGE